MKAQKKYSMKKKLSFCVRSLVVLDVDFMSLLSFGMSAFMSDDAVCLGVFIFVP